MPLEPRNQKVSLSDAVARDAALPAKGDYILWDSKTMYFGLRIQAGGSKTWIFQKKLGKRNCRVSLGVFSKNGVDARTGYTAAKAKLPDIVALVSKGIDPNLLKREQLRETESARSNEDFTVSASFEAYIEDKKKAGNTKTRTISDYSKSLERIKASALGKISLSVLTGLQLADYFDGPIRAKSEMSSRASNGGRTVRGGDLRYLRAAYNFSQNVLKMRVPEYSPFESLNEHRRGWYRVHSKERGVASVEGKLADWWAAVEKLRVEGDDARSRDVIADFLELALLWGSRRGETLALRWENINLTDNTICIPGKQTEYVDGTKNSRDHYFPITTYARKLLDKRWRVNNEAPKEGRRVRKAFQNGPSPWVFPSSRKNKNGEYSHLVEPKAAIKDVISECGVDFSAHDLRRTFGTLFDELGFGEYATRRALNHAPNDTASKHYIKGRMVTLRHKYQAYEDRVLIEAKVKEQPMVLPTISPEEYAKFQQWLANNSDSSTT